jgi:hypothetical protein
MRASICNRPSITHDLEDKYELEKILSIEKRRSYNVRKQAYRKLKHTSRRHKRAWRKPLHLLPNLRRSEKACGHWDWSLGGCPWNVCSGELKTGNSVLPAKRKMKSSVKGKEQKSGIAAEVVESPHIHTTAMNSLCVSITLDVPT